MTIDEAIKHCEEVAQDKECIAHSLTKDGWQEHFDNLTQEKETEYKNVRDEMANSCLECAKEHRQLAEWLKELKKYKEKDTPKLVVYSGDGYADGYLVYDYAECPNCGREFEEDRDEWEMPFCCACGQALKWEVEE